MRTLKCWPAINGGLYVPSVFKSCVHNERAALLLRTMGPTPSADPAERRPVRRMFALLRRLVKNYDNDPWTYRQTADSYTGAMRRRYQEAADSLESDPEITDRDALIKGFLKVEKHNSLRAKINKPRMISPRSPRYNLALACYLKPLEHWLWPRLIGFRFFGVPRSRICAKGLNGPARAKLIERKMSHFNQPLVLEIDGKAFEAHVDKWQIQCEHSLYEAAYGKDPNLRSLLVHQLHLDGVTNGGWKFHRPGARASGDFNTGMGNSLVMLCVTMATMREIGVRKFDLLADGDNCLLFVERDTDLSAFDATCTRISGQEMELEKPVTVLEHVRFGQSAPLRTALGLTMVRDPVKVISQGLSSHIHLRTKFGEAWAAGVGLCESYLNAGVPVLQAWAHSVRKLSAKIAPPDFYRHYQLLGVPSELRAVGHVPITAEARRSFEEAFGIGVERQIALENEFENVQWKFPTSCHTGEDVPFWDRDPELCGGANDPISMFV
jgi:hypothetical protein